MTVSFTSLVGFNYADGHTPRGNVIADPNGDLFGTTEYGGGFDKGTVFEIAKTATGYASSPTTLVSFNSFNGATPVAGLIADAKGDLFGTTSQGGSSNEGTVFDRQNRERLCEHSDHPRQLQRRQRLPPPWGPYC